MRPLRANVIRARVDGRIKGRIYCLQSDPESRSEDAACNAGGVHICRLVCLADNPFNAGQSFQIHFDEQAQLVTLDQERPRKATISNSAITWIATNGLVWTVDRLLGTFFSHEQGQDLNPPMGGYARGTCQKPPPRKF